MGAGGPEMLANVGTEDLLSEPVFFRFFFPFPSNFSTADLSDKWLPD